MSLTCGNRFMNVRMSEGWKRLLDDEFEQPYFSELAEFVRSEYRAGTVYPPAANVFRAFDKCDPDNIKVVIIGQDPYHGPGQANGLCFSVSDGVPFPPSLLNIFKEIESEFGTPRPESGNLDRWADQGVLLLNAVLTVRASQAASHSGHGWERFTDAVVGRLNTQRNGIVYMLWGAYARRKGAVIDRSANLVLECAHPSPLSAHNGFFGCGHFKKANDYLTARGLEAIEW